MSTPQLTAEAMALPISERLSLAQALWQSIDAGLEASKDILGMHLTQPTTTCR